MQQEGSQLLPHQPSPLAQREVPGDVPGMASPVSPSMDTSALGSGAGLEGLERFVAGPEGSSRGCMAVVLISANPAGHGDPTELVLWAGRSGLTPDRYLWVTCFLHLHFHGVILHPEHPRAISSWSVPFVQRAAPSFRLGVVLPPKAQPVPTPTSALPPPDGDPALPAALP